MYSSIVVVLATFTAVRTHPACIQTPPPIDHCVEVDIKEIEKLRVPLRSDVYEEDDAVWSWTDWEKLKRLENKLPEGPLKDGLYRSLRIAAVAIVTYTGQISNAVDSASYNNPQSVEGSQSTTQSVYSRGGTHKSTIVPLPNVKLDPIIHRLTQASITSTSEAPEKSYEHRGHKEIIHVHTLNASRDSTEEVFNENESNETVNHASPLPVFNQQNYSTMWPESKASPNDSHITEGNHSTPRYGSGPIHDSKPSNLEFEGSNDGILTPESSDVSYSIARTTELLINSSIDDHGTHPLFGSPQRSHDSVPGDLEHLTSESSLVTTRAVSHRPEAEYIPPKGGYSSINASYTIISFNSNDLVGIGSDSTESEVSTEYAEGTGFHVSNRTTAPYGILKQIDSREGFHSNENQENILTYTESVTEVNEHASKSTPLYPSTAQLGHSVKHTNETNTGGHGMYHHYTPIRGLTVSNPPLFENNSYESPPVENISNVTGRKARLNTTTHYETSSAKSTSYYTEAFAQYSTGSHIQNKITINHQAGQYLEGKAEEMPHPTIHNTEPVDKYPYNVNVNETDTSTTAYQKDVQERIFHSAENVTTTSETNSNESTKLNAIFQLSSVNLTTSDSLGQLGDVYPSSHLPDGQYTTPHTLGPKEITMIAYINDKTNDSSNEETYMTKSGSVTSVTTTETVKHNEYPNSILHGTNIVDELSTLNYTDYETTTLSNNFTVHTINPNTGKYSITDDPVTERYEGTTHANNNTNNYHTDKYSDYSKVISEAGTGKGGFKEETTSSTAQSGSSPIYTSGYDFDRQTEKSTISPITHSYTSQKPIGEKNDFYNVVIPSLTNESYSGTTHVSEPVVTRHSTEYYQYEQTELPLNTPIINSYATEAAVMSNGTIGLDGASQIINNGSAVNVTYVSESPSKNDSEHDFAAHHYKLNETLLYTPTTYLYSTEKPISITVNVEDGSTINLALNSSTIKVGGSTAKPTFFHQGVVEKESSSTIQMFTTPEYIIHEGNTSNLHEDSTLNIIEGGIAPIYNHTSIQASDSRVGTLTKDYALLSTTEPVPSLAFVEENVTDKDTTTLNIKTTSNIVQANDSTTNSYSLENGTGNETAVSNYSVAGSVAHDDITPTNSAINIYSESTTQTPKQYVQENKINHGTTTFNLHETTVVTVNEPTKPYSEGYNIDKQNVVSSPSVPENNMQHGITTSETIEATTNSVQLSDSTVKPYFGNYDWEKKTVSFTTEVIHAGIPIGRGYDTDEHSTNIFDSHPTDTVTKNHGTYAPSYGQTNLVHKFNSGDSTKSTVWVGHSGTTANEGPFYPVKEKTTRVFRPESSPKERTTQSIPVYAAHTTAGTTTSVHRNVYTWKVPITVGVTRPRIRPLAYKMPIEAPTAVKPCVQARPYLFNKKRLCTPGKHCPYRK